MVINSREKAEQDISRVKSCPPAARAREDNLKGICGQKVFFTKLQRNRGKTGEKLLQDWSGINPLWLRREGTAHMSSGDEASDFAARLKPPCAQLGESFGRRHGATTPRGTTKTRGTEVSLQHSSLFAGSSPSGWRARRVSPRW